MNGGEWVDDFLVDPAGLVANCKVLLVFDPRLLSAFFLLGFSRHVPMMSGRCDSCGPKHTTIGDGLVGAFRCLNCVPLPEYSTPEQWRKEHHTNML